ncbi:putative Molybdopterin synthase sulfurylase [Monocercomonoides exilis]|uniref:putative Molybdopterin synthase sulfurylase n=1 Tax=Monocercomonoides exilis TaxID=2049356 RepID=UPI0035596BAF|nr:putative Molybdopterin synthase sulfurylase [Monocercomonoides exilis]|eukprot:MONOS_2228.1-p1 / transcript=MONOS_2228.1 / gene=MONOS_2228 / organism=Monocercomonoides_exilis_PA203 / gene_product=Molybdopterin synthase sulfurylase / transcript_product=Molybdopterin synthase sulfurylase / location=Mono_scaffold00044:141262-142432(-) / protein_length=291 / sequence_SO=supercontig / SO=protein_coding / is_pseudo=false
MSFSKPDETDPLSCKEDSLMNEDFSRYERQMQLPEIGAEGQMKLKKSKILVVGVGGLGCNCALHLALSGIGTIGLVDFDEVELTNIHRQTLHTEETVGMKKIDSAMIQLMRHCKTSYVKFLPISMKIDRNTKESELHDLLSSYDVVCECTDSVDVRYIIGDATAKLHIPLVAGDAVAWDGQCTTYNFGDGPCLRCIHPIPPESQFVKKAFQIGVSGPVVNIISTVQALEAIKVVLGFPSLSSKIFVLDGKAFLPRVVRIRGKQTSCILCGDSKDNEDKKLDKSEGVKKEE